MRAPTGYGPPPGGYPPAPALGYGQPPAYGAGAYPPPGHYGPPPYGVCFAPPQQGNGLAVAGMVCGIIGVVLFWIPVLS